MTHRERLLAVIERRQPDRLPWVPRLQLWYRAHSRKGTLPEKYRDWSLREIEKDLGLGAPARDGAIFTTRLTNVEVRCYREGDDEVTEYITPVGSVSTRRRGSKELDDAGIGGRTTEYLIKRTEDYAVVEYMAENTEVKPDYKRYLAYERELGEDGVPLIGIGWCPMGQIMRRYIGYNDFFYELNDHPVQVEHLLEVLTEQAAKLLHIAAESPAKLLLYGGHFDSQFTPPPFFKKYFLPFFQEWAEVLHKHDKLLVCHADSDTSLILDLIREAGFDMAECFVTYPMVPCTLEQVRTAWGNDVIIWGGIPSTILCDPITDEYFEQYMLNLFKIIAPGDAFILGIADNVMPEARIERVRRVSEMVQEYGQYPVSAAQ